MIHFGSPDIPTLTPWNIHPHPFDLLTLPDYTNEQPAGYDNKIDDDQTWGFEFPSSSMDPQSEQNNIFTNNLTPSVPSAPTAASSSMLSYLHLPGSTHPASSCLSTSTSGYHFPTSAHPTSSCWVIIIF